MSEVPLYRAGVTQSLNPRPSILNPKPSLSRGYCRHPLSTQRTLPLSLLFPPSISSSLYPSLSLSLSLPSPLPTLPQIQPPPNEHGTYKTVKARFRPWFSVHSRQNLSGCSLFARKRSLIELVPERSSRRKGCPPVRSSVPVLCVPNSRITLYSRPMPRALSWKRSNWLLGLNTLVSHN